MDRVPTFLMLDLREVTTAVEELLYPCCHVLKLEWILLEAVLVSQLFN